MKTKVKLEKKPKGLNFQDLILQLSQFWVKHGCVLQQPYDVEVGAGTGKIPIAFTSIPNSK